MAQPIVDKMPLWWPEDAHVSFYYSYSDIDAITIKDVKNKILENCILDTVKIKLCTGSFELCNLVSNLAGMQIAIITIIIVNIIVIESPLLLLCIVLR